MAVAVEAFPERDFRRIQWPQQWLARDSTRPARCSDCCDHCFSAPRRLQHAVYSSQFPGHFSHVMRWQPASVHNRNLAQHDQLSISGPLVQQLEILVGLEIIQIVFQKSVFMHACMRQQMILNWCITVDKQSNINALNFRHPLSIRFLTSKYNTEDKLCLSACLISKRFRFNLVFKLTLKTCVICLVHIGSSQPRLHTELQILKHNPSYKNKIGKMYSLDYTTIPNVFFTPHCGRWRQQGNQENKSTTMVAKAILSKGIVTTTSSKVFIAPVL
jgi:hypothetical protein